MKHNLAQKLIATHLEEGKIERGSAIAIKIDQTLTQDATGTLVMLEFEAMGIERVKTELSAQYIDHNLIQEDYKNPDDHLFLQSACQKFGVWLSPAGNGVSHPVHMECFGKPGKTLLGSDSHTPAAGSLGMLAIGAGGMEVAMAMAGQPYYLSMPSVFGIRLEGSLPEWVSAKDVILEVLRRHGVDGGVGKIIEYHGPGLAHLSAMDRHVIANMGAELGATSTVFPADEQVEAFLSRHGRGGDFERLVADSGATYDEEDTINLSTLVPLIAKPSSPGNVVPVSELAGEPVYQCYVGSSANPGYRDFAMTAEIVAGKQVPPGVSFDINPTSRQILASLTESGALGKLIAAGARIHQSGCNGCIGMGQAPATQRNSLRTVPRNFPGRSGTKEDRVFLCSPETAAASALSGKIEDPRTLELAYPNIVEPTPTGISARQMQKPDRSAGSVEIERGPNIKPLPEFTAPEESFSAPVALKVGDDISTDEIMPAGSRILPYRSNIPEIARFVFEQVEGSYYTDCLNRDRRPHVIVAGSNYGQGSSREHAAVAPRYLGLSAVIAKGFARIHRANLINVGALPVTFEKVSDYDSIDAGDEIDFDVDKSAKTMKLHNRTKDKDIPLRHDLNDREWDIAMAGGLTNWIPSRATVNT